jgi:two-component system OmpR family response regulator
MRILLVEDDKTIAEAVQAHLTEQAFAVDWAPDLGQAREFLAVATYEMLLVDLGLPDGNGMDLIRDIRRHGSDAAVLILSAQDQISERISALNDGADDYLIKPFDLSELLARIAAVARRYTGQPQTQQTFGSLTIDTTNRLVLRDDVAVELSSREWAVLMRLVQRPDAIVPKTDIEDALYAFGAEVESNTVEVYVSRLRKKLGHDAIRTLRGVGYTVPRGEG